MLILKSIRDLQKLENEFLFICLKDCDWESEEENEGVEEKETRDLSLWKITIPHVIMETKQVIGNFTSSKNREDWVGSWD